MYIVLCTMVLRLGRCQSRVGPGSIILHCRSLVGFLQHSPSNKRPNKSIYRGNTIMNSPIALTPDLRPSENHMEKREKSVSDLIKTLKNHMGKKKGAKEYQSVIGFW